MKGKSKGKRPSISRIKPRGKKKPPRPESMDAEVPRRMNKEELYVQAKRLVTKIEMLKGFENRKRAITRELNDDIKATREAINTISTQLATGVEMVKQGDLFAGEGAAEVAAGAATPSQDQATQALANVAVVVEPAAAFVASLGERNGMKPAEMKRLLWQFCAKQKIRGVDARNALWEDVQERIAATETGPEPQASA